MAWWWHLVLLAAGTAPAVISLKAFTLLELPQMSCGKSLLSVLVSLHCLVFFSDTVFLTGSLHSSLTFIWSLVCVQFSLSNYSVEKQQ